MAGMRGIGGMWRVVQSAVLLLLVLSTASCGRAGSAPLVSTGPKPESDLFSDTNVARIDIRLTKADIKALRKYSWHHNRFDERPEVQATVVEGGWVYTNVALHLKGAAGSFRPIDDRPAFTLNFDKFAKGQKFHGLQKISLNNSVQDASFMDEKICRELFEASGVPVPRSDYAVVSLNGRPLGLYVLVEGYNKQFLKRHFESVKGNLYDGGFCSDIHDEKEVNSGENELDQSDRVRLVNISQAVFQETKLDRLREVLDMDRFISLMAMEVIQCHWDGYALNQNNYRLFHDRDSGRMVFMPHGLDQMFGTGERSDIYAPIMPRMKGLVAAAVMSTKEGRELYLRRLGELRTNVLKVEAITTRLRELERRLQPVLAEVEGDRVGWFRSEVTRLCDSIAGRAENIDQQLSQPSNELAFDDEGRAKIGGWRPRMNGPARGVFRMAEAPDGKEALQVTASREQNGASWRTRLWLPQGRYRFEGRARTAGVSGGGDSGATLRISGSQNRQVVRSEEWTPISFKFEIQEPNQEVELVCELKGNRGEAWFDRDSLRLQRD